MAKINAIEEDEKSTIDLTSPKVVRQLQYGILVEDAAIAEHGRFMGQKVSRGTDEWIEEASGAAHEIIDLAFARQINETGPTMDESMAIVDDRDDHDEEEHDFDDLLVDDAPDPAEEANPDVVNTSEKRKNDDEEGGVQVEGDSSRSKKRKVEAEI